MQRISVLFTCFNRKEKTLDALSHLYKAHQSVAEKISLSVYLTDDGSSDGTAQAVKNQYPMITILQGNGSLFWAGGMRNSWKAALKSNCDAYLLLNDDTNVYESLFTELIETHVYSLNTYEKTGIYIGSTQDSNSGKLSYGGAVFTNKFLAKYVKVIPNSETPQNCELGNANIMLVHKDVVDSIGILSDAFIHGLADFDYTLMAKKNAFPVLITPNYLGECTNDNKNPYTTFYKLPLKERIKVLYNPLGLDFKSNLQYMKRNFPYRLPLVYIIGWAKVLFPKIYVRRHIDTKSL